MTIKTSRREFIRRSAVLAAGDQTKLQELEKEMVKILKNRNATNEGKKLMLRELSWMGSDYSISSIEQLMTIPELADEAAFALERLNIQ